MKYTIFLNIMMIVQINTNNYNEDYNFHNEMQRDAGCNYSMKYSLEYNIYNITKIS